MMDGLLSLLMDKEVLSLNILFLLQREDVKYSLKEIIIVHLYFSFDFYTIFYYFTYILFTYHLYTYSLHYHIYSFIIIQIHYIQIYFVNLFIDKNNIIIGIFITIISFI